MVLAHAAAFAAFFGLTTVLMEGHGVSSEWTAFSVLAWAVTDFGAGVFWLLTAMAGRAWINLGRHHNNSGILGFGFRGEQGLGATSRPDITVGELASAIISAGGCLSAGGPFGRHPAIQYRHLPRMRGLRRHWPHSCVYGHLFLAFPGQAAISQSFILQPCAILVMWFVNAARIASLVMLGTHVSPRIAMGGFHSQTGWLGFIAVALGMVAVTQRIPFFAAEEFKLQAKVVEADPTTAYLAPLMALLGIGMLSGIFISGLDWLYPARVVATGTAIWVIWRKSINRANLARTWSWNAVETEHFAKMSLPTGHLCSRIPHPPHRQLTE